jgi:hypothetical protein
MTLLEMQIARAFSLRKGHGLQNSLKADLLTVSGILIKNPTIIHGGASGLIPVQGILDGG